MKKVRAVREWAARVLELGPQFARRDVLRFLEEAEAALRRAQEEGEVLDELAEDVLGLCLENLIQAPPGLHGRLLKLDGYRSRLPFMRRI